MKKIIFLIFLVSFIFYGMLPLATSGTISFKIKLLNLTNSPINNITMTSDTYETLGDNYMQSEGFNWNDSNYNCWTLKSLDSMSSGTFSGQDQTCSYPDGESGVGISFGSLKFDYYLTSQELDTSTGWSNLETVDESQSDGVNVILNVNTTTPSGKCEGYIYEGAAPWEGPDGASDSECVYALIVLLPGSINN